METLTELIARKKSELESSLINAYEEKEKKMAIEDLKIAKLQGKLEMLYNLSDLDFNLYAKNELASK